MTHPQPASTAPRIALLVIHGWSGAFADALREIDELFRFEAQWQDGIYLVDRRIGLLLRQVLNYPYEPNGCIHAFQKLILSRFLRSCGRAHAGAHGMDIEQTARFYDEFLVQEFADFGIPWPLEARLVRARQMEQEARCALDGLLETIHELRRDLGPSGTPLTTELDARRRILDAGGQEFLSLLESIRDMHETGGDLDTVGSAVLYTHWLCEQARRDNRPFVYGVHYRYVFLNYHESLSGFGAYGPADVYMADIPIAAFPEFEADARALAAKDVRLARFEDHHPYSQEQLAMLKRLQHDGILGMLALSGPLQGQDLAVEDLKCGTDMVYESCVQGRPWDVAGAKALRRSAHGEDFVTDRDELGILLTQLIKGGICKIELAQVILESLTHDRTLVALKERHWDTLATVWQAGLTKMEDRLLAHVHMVQVATGDSGVLSRSEVASNSDPVAEATGSDMEGYSRHKTGRLAILIAHAARSEPGQPKIPVGKAIEYYSRVFPEADYVFYCYGASILVARRLNQAETALNLGELMPKIGRAGDGGHAGAAVCRPEANPQYPARLLGRVRAANFTAFVKYLGRRLAEAGYPVLSAEDCSDDQQRKLFAGGRKILLLTTAALFGGTLLLLFHPRFAPGRIAESNRDFFAQLDAVTEDSE